PSGRCASGLHLGVRARRDLGGRTADPAGGLDGGSRLPAPALWRGSAAMTRRTAIGLLSAMLVLAGCTSSTPVARDPGRVVLPVKLVPVPGRLYATKGRALYRFSGTAVTRLRFGSRVMDPAVTSSGDRIAVAQLQDQSSTIVVTDANGQNRQSLTPAAAGEGALWAFAPGFDGDAHRIVYLTDRGKPPSSPQNLHPNDLGVWSYDLTSGQSR